MPTTPERLIEIATRHISHNERLKSHNVKEYSDFLDDMKNSVTNQLANKDLTKFSRDRLLTLEKNIASDIKEINQAAAGTLKSQARDLAKYESQFEVKALSDVVEHSFNLPSTSQLNSAVFKTPLAGIEGPMKGKLLDSVIKDWSDRTVDRVNNVITSGYYQGKTTAAIVKDVVGTGANFTGGSLAQVKRDTEGLVRTSLQHAANQARQETWNQNSDIVKGVRISATLDSKTSTICRTLDGQVYALDEGPRPPFHINCRTTTVAALDSRFKALDEGATRSARDPETGEVYKVDSQRTYYDWLRGQPGNVQDSILGPTRGKLLRDGGLTSKRFAELQLSKNFQPMTLAEMKALEPVAFEKAGIDLAKAGKAPGTIDLRYGVGKAVPEVPQVVNILRLEDYEVIDNVDLGGGINQTRLLTMASPTGEVKGVFKPVKGEVWVDKGDTIRDTITNKSFSYADREVLSSRIAEELGISTVPKTVHKKINTAKGRPNPRKVQRGSLQLFLEDVDEAMGSISPTDPRFQNISRDEMYQASVFDFLIGNTDRHLENILITKKGKIGLIDNGLSFPSDNSEILVWAQSSFSKYTQGGYKKENFLKWDSSVSAAVKKSLTEKINKLDLEKLTSEYKLSPEEKLSLLKRYDKIKSILDSGSPILTEILADNPLGLYKMKKGN